MRPANRKNVMAAIGSGAIVSAMVTALIAGLAVTLAPESSTPLEAVLPSRNVPTPPKPEPAPKPVPTAAQTSARTKGGGSSPPPESPSHSASLAPPIVLSSPVPAQSGSGNAGGSGSVGSGSGAGSGNGAGSGSGAGYGSGSGYRLPEVMPRQTAGRLHFSDLPADLRKRRQGDVLTLRYRIGTDGRVTGCTILKSSGDPALDESTCALITRRFRFRPARDANGAPVAFTMTENHGWDNASAPADAP